MKAILLIPLFFWSHAFCYPETEASRIQTPNLLESGTEEFVIGTGRYVYWKVPPQYTISVSEDRIVRVADYGDRVRITGLRSGELTLTAGPYRIQIIVLSAVKHALYERLKRVLQERRGLYLKVWANEIMVQGRLLRLNDWKALAKAQKDFPFSYQFQAQVEKTIASDVKDYFLTKLRRNNLDRVRVDLEPNAQIHYASEAEHLKKGLQNLFVPYGFSIYADPETVLMSPSVRINVLVTEMYRSAFQRIGIQWPHQIEAQMLSSQSLLHTPGFTLSAHMLENEGLGRILASPTLLTRSGKEATFLAGGEIPITNRGFGQSQVNWRPYGLQLRFLPKAESSGRLSVSITTEISSIDTSVTIQGVPGLRTHRMETHFNMKTPRVIALSGFVKEDFGTSQEGLPHLQKIPILGGLFRSRDHLKNRTELVILVLPEVLDLSEGQE